jgi:hypothetical protein
MGPAKHRMGFVLDLVGPSIRADLRKLDLAGLAISD